MGKKEKRYNEYRLLFSWFYTNQQNTLEITNAKKKKKKVYTFDDIESELRANLSTIRRDHEQYRTLWYLLLLK